MDFVNLFFLLFIGDAIQNLIAKHGNKFLRLVVNKSLSITLNIMVCIMELNDLATDDLLMKFRVENIFSEIICKLSLKTT